MQDKNQDIIAGGLLLGKEDYQQRSQTWVFY
jgi:hypothetical protein